MKHRNRVRGIASLLLGLLAACSAPDEERPNFLVISIDTLNRSVLRAFDPGAVARLGPDPHLEVGQVLAEGGEPSLGGIGIGMEDQRHGVRCYMLTTPVSTASRSKAAFMRAGV